MIKIPVVHQCPYTGAGMGVARVSHEVLAILAGAVHDHEEWMAFLVGKRSPDGLDVTVTELRVPQQYRSQANCETVKEEPLLPDVVGVVHSHHNMTAFFSNTDDTKLNPRFPISIVVAQPRATSPVEARLLGFDYQGEGRAPLPCGTIGIIKFKIQPLPMVKDWPVTVVPQYDQPTDSTLRFCPNIEQEYQGMESLRHAKCGVTKTESIVAYFGQNGQEFIKEVNEKTKSQIRGQQFQVSDKRFKRYVERSGVWDDDDFLRHWSSLETY